MRTLKDERGQTLVLTAVSMSLLLACVALAVDVGTLFNARRKVQIAADAAAVAGALELAYNGNTSAVTTNANNAANANGITDTNNVSVTVGPTDGSHQANTFVRVVISQPNPTTFMSIFVPGKINVAARAVAGTVASQGCVSLLNTSAAGALSAKGAFAISSGCGWEVNSSSQQAVCITGAGNNGSFSASYVKFHATKIKTSGSCNGTLTTPVYTGAGSISDPLGGLGNPTCTPDTTTTTITPDANNSPNGNTYCYSQPITISGSGYLNGGIYVFLGGVTIKSGSNITVPAGTFDIAENPGTLKESGGQSCLGGGTRVGFVQQSNSSLTINAPTTLSGASKVYNGIAIMEPSTVTSPLEVQFGSNSGNYGSAVITGLIYAPSAPVYLHDNGGGTSATGLIADTLNVCSSTLTIANYNTAAGNASPLNTVSLVE